MFRYLERRRVKVTATFSQNLNCVRKTMPKTSHIYDHKVKFCIAGTIFYKIFTAKRSKQTSLTISSYELKEEPIFAPVQLPDLIGELSDLEELKIIGVNLTSLPTSIGKLTKLKTLHLHKNLLSDLPPSFGKLSNLEELDIKNNLFTNLPDPICKLPQLKRLNLSSNPLTGLPDNITKLQHLEELGLSMNVFQGNPPCGKKMPALEWIQLQDNKISSLKRLKNLCLEGHSISV